MGDRLAADHCQGRFALVSSTPDALWSSRVVRLLRPAAVDVRGLRAGGSRRGAELRGLDLSVPVGARLLVASRPEGSGSLLLRALAGLSRPAGGSMAVAGVRRADDSREGWARRVGYVGPDSAIYPWLSPGEALTLAARLAELEESEVQRRVDDAIEHFRLGPAAQRPMSRGGPVVVQLTGLAAAMLAEPEVLLLDEPLRSVDPLERRRLLAFPDRRITVLLATRYVAGEEGVVNQVCLIREGRLAVHATVEDLWNAGLPLSLRGIEQLAERGDAPRLHMSAMRAQAPG